MQNSLLNLFVFLVRSLKLNNLLRRFTVNCFTKKNIEKFENEPEKQLETPSIIGHL